MLKDIKKQFYDFLTGLGYNATDNLTYKEQFPWLMVNVQNYQLVQSRDIDMEVITLKLDIFSVYNGEKEIIDIADNIAEHLKELRANPNITAITQHSMKIIGDKETGPVRKHGVIYYKFIVTNGQEVYDDTARN